MEQQKNSAGEAVARVQALLASLAEARSETARLERRRASPLYTRLFF